MSKYVDVEGEQVKVAPEHIRLVWSKGRPINTRKKKASGTKIVVVPVEQDAQR